MNKSFRYLLPVLFISMILTSCTKNFDDINRNHQAISEIGPEDLPYLFSKALSVGAPFSYQTYQNLYPDLYAQYFATTSTGFATDRYTIRYDWLDNNWTNQYTTCVPQLRTIFDHTDANSGAYALTSIWWVYIFHHIVDYWGPVPYFRAGISDGKPVEYDAQDAIYDDFFKRLDEAVATLNSIPEDNVFGNFDLIYGGNKQQWIVFANTLRLRLALRISGIDPQRAKTEAEAAVASGVMTDNSQDAMMVKSLAGNDYNPLAHIAVWNEFSMSATMYSYLVGYDDPRISRYFQPALNTGEYAGLRNGQPTADLNKTQNLPGSNSQIGPSWVQLVDSAWKEQPTRKQDIMHCAEAYFLKAEGALNGWNMGGDAQQFYEEGIRKSMQQWAEDGLNAAIPSDSMEAYIASENLPIAPTGLVTSGPVSSVTVHWSADPNTERKQIAIQKWIALYPDGFEAWAEVRRTGYPDLYPIIQSDNPDLPLGTTIKRLPFPTIENTTDKVELQKGVQLLNGADNAATSLWWDVN